MHSKTICCIFFILLISCVVNVHGFGLFNALQQRSDAINFLRIKRDLQLNCIDKDCDGVCPCSTGYCWGNACSCFPCQPMTDPPVDEEAQEQGRRRR